MNTFNDKIVSSYYNLIHSIPNNAESLIGERSVGNLRAFLGGVDGSLAAMFGINSSLLMLFQENLEKNHEIIGSAGFEERYAKNEGKGFDCFFYELKVFEKNVSDKDVFTMRTPCEESKERDLDGINHCEAALYLSIYRLCVMPAHLIGSDSFHQAVIWMSGYFYAIKCFLKKECTFDKDFNSFVMKHFQSDCASWKDFVSRGKTDQEAFAFFKYLFIEYLEVEKPSYKEYVLKYAKIPNWITSHSKETLT